MDHSRNSAEIDLNALAHNLKQVRTLLLPRTGIMGVVKADAYGHGLIPVSRALKKAGVDSLGVAHFHEAMQLRQNGLDLPVFILSGIRTRDEAAAAVANNMNPVLFDLSVAEIIAEEGRRLGKRAGIHVKVDTGMGRLGVPCASLVPFLEKLKLLPSLDVAGLFSHLSSADDTDRVFTEAQVRHFKDAVETARALGLALPLNSLANSAGIMAYREAHWDLVRPGIMLYGGLPCPGFEPPVSLKPAMTFKGEVLQVREMPAGVPVSYSRTYHTPGTRTIAVLSAGYADGILRSLSNRGEVLIRGRRAAIVGRVCMNLTMADVTALGAVQAGDEAVFVGCQGKACLTADEVASRAGTISYEVLCSIGQRSVRAYVS